ncbi:MAG: class I SAM-dependent methyltransferase [Solirubrobacteraceae bacterium]
MSAELKVAHLLRLSARAGWPLPTTAVLEVGCGDGAVLAQLRRHAPAAELVGVEVSRTAADLARGRSEISRILVFDGGTLPFEDDSFELVFATHVLEHVADPVGLLREMRRVSRGAVAVEVPLERNVAARRPAAVALSRAAGHVQRFGRSDVSRLLAEAGLRRVSDFSDPLPRRVRTFQDGAWRGTAKWAVRSALAGVPGGERLMTVHYAALALPA